MKHLKIFENFEKKEVISEESSDFVVGSGFDTAKLKVGDIIKNTDGTEAPFIAIDRGYVEIGSNGIVIIRKTPSLDYKEVTFKLSVEDILAIAEHINKSK
jgi:hypothetical protein